MHNSKKVIDNEHVSIQYNSTVTEMRGEDNHVTEVTITNQDTNDTYTKKTRAVFIAIGLKPNNDFIKNQLDLTDSGHIKVHERTRTSIEGVFAAGDVIDPYYRQAITSSGMGCMATLDAERYIKRTL
jgi:thioredoxin reductase (NADPH)